MDLEECKRKGFVKRCLPNTGKALSLVEVSDIKESVVRKAKLDATNVNAYLPMAYDALRETLDALCLLLGYSVSNHVCLGELLRTLVPEFDYHSFDRFRYVRNGINYYGKKIDLKTGKEFITNIFRLRKEIKGLIESRMD